MKEQIYTIPINEAYETDCECPLCLLEKKCEEEAVDYALGAAMMEPDFRMESNQKGYCGKHFEMLNEKPNKLSLALVMETLVAENITELEKFTKKIDDLKKDKCGLFRKSGSKEIVDELCQMLKKREDSCIICDKINYTMGRYTEVFIDMWRTEPEFRSRVEQSKGFCLVHMRKILEAAEKNLSDKQLKEFAVFLYEKQTAQIKRISEEVHRFTLKFDYRNKDMEWGNAQDAPVRSIEKVAGTIRKSE
ncbi:MAG: ABC transporter substrate-binding protein [Clostridia bacterium]|nr:ABC transporter substrate-binding protein [Clostridia bacterium]